MAGFGIESLILRGPSGVTDLSVDGNDGTYRGGMSVVTDTDNGGTSAFNFDGTDDYIETVASELHFASSYDLTVAGFVKYTSTTNDLTIFTAQRIAPPFTGSLFRLCIVSSGRLSASIRNAANSAFFNITNGVASNDNVWHLFAFRSSASGTSLWVDGSTVATGAAMFATPSNQIASVGAFRNSDGSSSSNWLGKIDDMRTVPSLLTDGQLSSWYVAGRGYDVATGTTQTRRRRDLGGYGL